jgi:beta-galactosidase/beta-glucuronidase
VAAADNDGSYPRPQLVRHGWKSLDGVWAFAFDDDRVGQRERWFDVDAEARFPSTITVPFPPESRASGVHDTGFHPVVWYRRLVTSADLVSGDSSGDRTLLHFGAVDHHAYVWFDGVLVGEHSGGQTPFHVDVTNLRGSGRDEHVLVVRAEDDPLDAALPRGKQDWEPAPHGIWYHRTTGIWQTVWTETVPELHLTDVAWMPQVAASSVTCALELSARPTAPVEAEVLIQLDGEDIAHHVIRLDGPRAVATISLPGMANGQDRARFVWSPEHPVLFDAQVTLRSPGAPPTRLDEVSSYFGMRSAAVGRGHFLLNGHPYYMRSVLDQGYWSDTHLANPGSSWLREEVELMKQMGFNAVRKHQKAEDPRFLYWADRLGLLVWGETANAYEYSTTAVELLTREWLDLVRRDRSHPSIVAWVPLNESWGVQDIAADGAQQAYAGGLAQLTRALDPSRPVMSNEGWEHVDSDILGLHDYSSSPRRSCPATATRSRSATCSTRTVPRAHSAADASAAGAIRRRRRAVDDHRVRWHQLREHRGVVGILDRPLGGRVRAAARRHLRRSARMSGGGRLLLHAAARHRAGDQRAAHGRPQAQAAARADPGDRHGSVRRRRGAHLHHGMGLRGGSHSHDAGRRRRRDRAVSGPQPAT